MLKKILLKINKKWQLVGAVLGTLIGLFLILFSIQLYIDVYALLNDRKYMLGQEFLILNKPVSLLTSTNLMDNYFTEDELLNIKEQKFIKDAEPFIYSNFSARFYVNLGGNQPTLYSSIFFETIPDKFIDVDKEEWNWTSDSNFIPIILPTDYLALYNFGFAPGRNLPQISKGTVETILFNIIVSGTTGSQDMIGRVIGLSDRLNTVLVPMGFMNWANEKFMPELKQFPKKIIIMTDDPSNPALLDFLQKNGYETNQEKLKSSKLNVLFNAVLLAVAFIGVIIVILSIIVFLLSLQLIISESRDKISLLIQLGYKYTNISKTYFLFVSVFILSIFIINFVLIFFVKAKFTSWFGEFGFELPSGINFLIYVIGIVLLIFIILINMLNIHRNVKKLT
ncbi:MAG: hypothetical protein JW866_07005 [Ignavibacteriales bacterium]|nr:hypothetical protein [Ignavibacteriales bacterium]